jgi:hypothetical protein
MAHHIFQSETELQNIPEAAPKASPSFSVSEKLVTLVRLKVWLARPSKNYVNSFHGLRPDCSVEHVRHSLIHVRLELLSLLKKAAKRAHPTPKTGEQKYPREPRF